jgi:hypothetical protein
MSGTTRVIGDFEASFVRTRSPSSRMRSLRMLVSARPPHSGPSQQASRPQHADRHPALRSAAALMPLRFAHDTAIFTNAVPNWGITARQSSSFDFNSSRSAAITSSRRRTSSLSRSDSLTIVPRSAVRRALALDKASIVFWSSANRFRLHIATTRYFPLRVTSTAGNLAGANSPATGFSAGPSATALSQLAACRVLPRARG